MPEIDTFATLLLEEAKRFLETAVATDDEVRRDAYLHAALMLGFSSLEAHINAICEEFSSRPEFSVHEKAFLLEQEVRLEGGEFRCGGLKMSKLEDRITFLYRHFSGKSLDKQAACWSALGTSIKLRNKLTHPKGIPAVTVDSVQSAIRSIIDALDSLYQAIYKKPFPAANRGLHSRLMF